jgi:hypothetical protein
MTSEQYYFPYFFDQKDLNKSLEKYGLSTLITFDKKSKLANDLIITERKSFNLFGNEREIVKFPFHTILMIANDELIYWKINEEIIDIGKINLIDLLQNIETTNSKIDISKMSLGDNIYQTYLGLNNFVTFVKKNDLVYDQDYYENYVIVIVNNENIKLIPFEKFNKTGGDYGYVWPAIARIDNQKKILYGKGIRMNNFEFAIE